MSLQKYGFFIFLIAIVIYLYFNYSLNQKNYLNNVESFTSENTNSNFDNYNHYKKQSSSLTSGNTFYGPNGTTATVVQNSDETQSLKIQLPGSNGIAVFNETPTTSIETFIDYFSVTKYYGPNGSTATILTSSNGQKYIKVTINGKIIYYYTKEQLNTEHIDKSTEYFGSTGTQLMPDSNAYNDQIYSSTDSSNQSSLTNENNYPIDPYYGKGIPKSQIPKGQEDMYILKSEIVPPVCPACPTVNVAGLIKSEDKCPPCPACARCPEPAFECKKVPNYNSIDNNYLPSPFLNGFSQFGM